MKTIAGCIGYIYVENRSAAKSFSASDVELVEGFAAQAGLALENAQLVDRLTESCDALAKARSDAVRAESLRVLGKLASEVAHDFNNLLTAILGETQLLMQDQSTVECRGSLEVIERAAMDGAQVIRRIQDSTRVRNDRDFDVVDPRQLVLGAIDIVRRRSERERIRVAYSLADGLRVRGVPTELREVLTNVMSNALDAMPNGGLLSVDLRREAEAAVITVGDTGCGMDAATVAHAFDPFFTTKGSKGNGLGLSIAFGVLQRHGGKITLDSAVGRGTRVKLAIPLAAPTESGGVGESTRGTAQVGVAGIRGGGKAWVIDDQVGVARVLVSMLRRAGLDAEEVDGGHSALERIRKCATRVDYLITDLNMPEVNGIEIARAAIECLPGARVVVMSGSLAGREAELNSISALHVLRKPFTIDDVQRVVLGQRDGHSP